MAVNKRKVLEAARKHATKGAKDKALKEYNKLLKLDPRDSKLRLEIGDAHRRWGQVAEATETYTKVAEQFMKEGFDARAVAVYKQILTLDSESFSCYEPLAELYQRMGLTGEATGALQIAADGFHRAGDKGAALGLLRKMAMLEPTNTTSRLKVADLLHKEGMNDEAIVEYESVVEELRAQGDAEEISRVYERLLDVEPERVSSLTGYARNLIDRNAADRAEPFARRALDADPSPAQYELLGEVYRATGRDEELIELYRQLAELYRERGDEERTREILQRYVPPTDFASTTGPNGYIDDSEMSATPDEANRASDELEPIDELDELGPLDDDGRDDFGDKELLDEDLMADDSQLLGDGDSGFGILTGLDQGNASPIVDAADGPNANEMTRVIPDDAEPMSNDVEQLFAEASVYLRYGKRDQAVANLENVLEIDPSHRGALEKLGEAFVEADDKARAVDLWSRAAKLACEDNEIDAASAIRDRISAIDASAAASLVIEPAVNSLSGDPNTEETPILNDLSDDADDEFIGEFLSDDDPQGSPESDLDEIELGDIEIDVDDTSFVVKPKGPRKIEAQAEITEPDSAAAEASEALTFDASANREANPEQITEDIEEADFYFQQGLLDEAEAIYSRVLEVAPNHPHAMVRMGEVAAQRGDAPGSSAVAPEPVAPLVETTEEPADLESTDTGSELAWNDDLPDELEVGPISEDAAGLEFDEPGAEELSVADLSMGSFANATEDDTNDANGDTKDLLEDLPADLVDEPDEAGASLEAEIDIDVDDDFEADFDLDDDALDTGDGANDGANDGADQTQPPEFMFELPPEGADADSEPELEPPPETQEPAAPELAVTSIDFGDETDAGDGDSAEDGNEEPDDGGCGFDLAAEIGDALDEDPNESTSGNSADTSDDGFAAVFAEFKKGVSETLTEGDFEAHYDLGIAYREMGLFDDAMTEFQAAMASPNRRLGCLHLLGLCALDAGQPEDATAHLQSALETEDLASEQVLALRLDLGRCFEQSGDLASAKSEYLAVQAENSEFGGVGSLLEGIGDPDKPAADEPQYESFEEFFDDSDDDDADDDDADDDPDDPDVAVDDAAEPAFDDIPELTIDATAEPADGESHDREHAEHAEPEILEMEALVETEPVIELEAEPEPEPEPEPLPETEPEPELPKARKKRKISFF